MHYLCIMMKDTFYQYAICDGQLVHIDDVTEENRHSSKYYCINCNHEMVPVLGRKKRHHFRHKASETCNWETYLHKLSKHIIKLLFDNQEEFIVQYPATNVCPELSNCILRRCTEEFVHSINLKEYYDQCIIEGTYNGFRGDVMLTDSKNPSHVLFIEIAVTHKCTPEKLKSGIRIIEIEVTDELSCLKPIVESDKIRFYNFKRHIIPSVKTKKFIACGQGKHVDSFLIKNCDCIDSNNHLDSSVYELSTTNNVEDKELKNIGFASLIKDNYEARFCQYCYHVRKKYSACKKPLVLTSQGIMFRTYEEQHKLASNCNSFLSNQWWSRDYLKGRKSIYDYKKWEKKNE